MVSGCMQSRGDRWQWVRDGWATDRGLFVAVCVVAATCGLSVWVGGIVMLINDPPPFAVGILAAVYGLVELWRRQACCAEPDVDDSDVVDVGWEFELT